LCKDCAKEHRLYNNLFTQAKELYAKQKAMKFQIIKLSNDLLQANAFNHFTDKDLEALKKAMQLMSLEYLIETWYKADFFCSWKAEQLLMPCNQVLYTMGLPTLSCLVENELDF